MLFPSSPSSQSMSLHSQPCLNTKGKEDSGAAFIFFSHQVELCSTLKFVETASFPPSFFLKVFFIKLKPSGCTVDNKPLLLPTTNWITLAFKEKNQETAFILKEIVSWFPNYFHPQSEVEQDQQ